MIVIEDGHECSNFHFLHCEGDHSPQSQICPRFRFESEITQIAHNEHVSYGKAKNMLMGANKSPDSTYAKIITQIKLTEVKKPQISFENNSKNGNNLTTNHGKHMTMVQINADTSSQQPDIKSTDDTPTGTRPKESLKSKKETKHEAEG